MISVVALRAVPHPAAGAQAVIMVAAVALGCALRLGSGRDGQQAMIGVVALRAVPQPAVGAQAVIMVAAVALGRALRPGVGLGVAGGP